MFGKLIVSKFDFHVVKLNIETEKRKFEKAFFRKLRSSQTFLILKALNQVGTKIYFTALFPQHFLIKQASIKIIIKINLKFSTKINLIFIQISHGKVIRVYFSRSYLQ